MFVNARSLDVLSVPSQVGEFVYHVGMTATPAAPSSLPQLSAELGKSTTTSVSFENLLQVPVVLDAMIQDRDNDSRHQSSRCFSVSPPYVSVEPGCSTTLKVTYSPTTLDAPEQALLTLDAGEAGCFDYHLCGQGQLPGPMEATSMGAIIGHSAQCVLAWRNPFPEAASVNVTLDSSEAMGVFELLMRGGSEALVPPFGTLQIPLSFTPAALKMCGCEVVVSVEASSYSLNTLAWRFPVRATSEASTAGVVFRYKCRARGRCDEEMEVVLDGLAHVSAEDTFTHELVFPTEHRTLLESALRVTRLSEPACLSSPGQPLRYRVVFAPPRMLPPTSLQFIVYKSTGGRWRFEMQLQATEPDLDGTLTLEAATGQASLLPLNLYASGPTPQPFTASFALDTPVCFSVTPAEGMLPPAPAPGEATPQPALQVVYSCKEFGKVQKGKLFVHTADMQYSYELRGRMPTYVPPRPDQFEKSIDDRLDPLVDGRLSRGQPARRNFVASNLKSVKGSGHLY